MKKILLSCFVCLLLFSCSKDDGMDASVEVSFILVNDLLWNIGHDYYVSGVDGSGNAFDGTEQYITIMNYLLQSQKVKIGSELVLYRDSSVLWTSDPIEKPCTISYCDSAFKDTVEIE